MSNSGIVILLAIILLFGIAISFAVFEVPKIQEDYNKLLQERQETNNKYWDCVDACDLNHTKPSHESCVRMCYNEYY